MAAAAVEFLPVGDDSNAWSYHVVAADGSRRHLKVRRGPVDPATVLVPMALRDHGLAVVVISHNLADVFQVADTIVVLRLGHQVGVLDAKQTDSDEVVATITGLKGAEEQQSTEVTDQ